MSEEKSFHKSTSHYIRGRRILPSAEPSTPGTPIELLREVLSISRRLESRIDIIAKCLDDLRDAVSEAVGSNPVSADVSDVDSDVPQVVRSLVRSNATVGLDDSKGKSVNSCDETLSSPTGHL